MPADLCAKQAVTTGFNHKFNVAHSVSVGSYSEPELAKTVRKKVRLDGLVNHSEKQIHHLVKSFLMGES